MLFIKLCTEPETMSKVLILFRRLVEVLNSMQVDIYLISGGFDQLIFPVARLLSIPEENVFANKLLFDEKGQYIGFDEEQPTSQAGGKGKAIEALKQRKIYRHVIMVGDGATDAEACPPAVRINCSRFFCVYYEIR